MKIIAHRCGTDAFPEQTIHAARYSLTAGADLVEVDIRFSKDGVPVVIHDPTPESLYGCAVPVSELTAKEFLALRRTADPAFCGHTFHDYLECGIDRMLFHNKIGGERLKEIAALCEKYGIADKVVFGVTRPEDVRIVKLYSERLRVLAFMRSPEDTEASADAGADYIRLWEKWCTPENIDRVKKTGRKLWIMSDSPEVGEVTDGCYGFYESTGADGVLVNRIVPALEYFRR